MRSVSPRRRACSALAAIVMCSACVTPAGAQSDADQSRAALEVALQSVGVSGQLDSQVVVAWNESAHDIALAEDQFLTFKGQRALAMMHLAMHDALNSIVPVYERYAHTASRPIAHPIAAAAQAAHDVLRRAVSRSAAAAGRRAHRLARPTSRTRVAITWYRAGTAGSRGDPRASGPTMDGTCQAATSFVRRRASTRPRLRGMALSHNPAFDLPGHSRPTRAHDSSHRHHRRCGVRRYANAFQEVKESARATARVAPRIRQPMRSGGWSSRRAP